MPDLIIQSRITPKKVLKNIISRTELIDEIERNIDKNLILVSAPAGYGKTTLVQDFLSKHSHTYAWFHVTSDLSNFYTFISYIVHSLKVLNKDFGANTIEAVESLKQSMNLTTDLKNIITIITGTLINDFQELFTGEVILVLDDLHEVQGEPWFNLFFDTMLDSVPPNLHIIITSRSIPEFNLAKISSKRNLLTIDAKKLQFAKGAIDELLKDVYQITPGKGGSELLEKKMNGWITGIHLVLQAYGENYLKADFTSEDIFSFFANEIFSKLESNLQDFLLKTCYLDNFTAGICDNIIGITSSKEIIIELISKNIFIEFTTLRNPDTGKTTNTYNYHKLFKEFLSTTLHKIRSEQEVNEIIQKIYTYYKETGNNESAINFSLFAKNYEAAIELIKLSFNRFYEDSRFELLWKWLGEIPESIINADRRLLYYKGMLYRFYKSDADNAFACFKLASKKPANNVKDDLHFEIEIQTGEILHLLERKEESLNHLEKLSHIETSPYIKAKTLNSLAYTYYRIGPEHYDKILKIVDDGIELCKENDLNKYLINFYNLSGLVNSHKGDIIKSIYFYDLVLKNEKYVINRMMLINNIIPLYVWSGKPKKAMEYLEEGADLYKSFPSLLLKRLHLRTKALFYFDTGDYEQAIKMLEEVLDIEIKNNIKRLLFLYYLFIGESYMFLNKRDLAEKYYDIAEANKEEGNDYHQLELNLHYTILNKITAVDKSTEKTLLESLNYFEQNGLIYAKAQIEFHLADYYYKAGLMESAVKFLKDSLKTSSEKQYVSYLEQLYPGCRYLFDFAISNNIQKDFIKDILVNILNKEDAPWLSEECRKRIKLSLPLLFDIHMRAFGGIEIMVRGNVIEEDRWIRKKSKMILAYLLLNPDMKFTKDKILGIFFPDLNSQSAENVFHQAITNIRNALKFDDMPQVDAGETPKAKTKIKKRATKKEKESESGPNFILYEDKVLRLNPNYYYKVDAIEFNEIYHKIKSAETKPDEKEKSGARALELYRGELLAGNYDEWCEELRTNYSNKFTDLCEEMIAFYKQKNKYSDLIIYAERLIQCDKLHEDAYVNLIEAYVKMGNFNAGRTKLTQLLKVYDEEYGEKPPKAIMNRVQELLSQE